MRVFRRVYTSRRTLTDGESSRKQRRAHGGFCASVQIRLMMKRPFSSLRPSPERSPSCLAPHAIDPLFVLAHYKPFLSVSEKRKEKECHSGGLAVFFFSSFLSISVLSSQLPLPHLNGSGAVNLLLRDRDVNASQGFWTSPETKSGQTEGETVALSGAPFYLSFFLSAAFRPSERGQQINKRSALLSRTLEETFEGP